MTASTLSAPAAPTVGELVYLKDRDGVYRVTDVRASSIGLVHAETGTAVRTSADNIVPDDGADCYGCECGNCPLHGGTSRPTFLERRYTDDDDDPRGF